MKIASNFFDGFTTFLLPVILLLRYFSKFDLEPIHALVKDIVCNGSWTENTTNHKPSPNPKPQT